MALTDIPARPPLLFRLPVLRTIFTDIQREPDSIFYLIVGVLSLLIIATVNWGLAVLSMAALAMVPVMFVLLILITRG
ncbi:MAG: hypothetical protein ACK4S2_07195 [Gemmobacter sp.]|uniref:hypothetical protein n=1 Tax=Gemmobacter sp. TaxID=1898957 RepID=UPI00391A0129